MEDEFKARNAAEAEKDGLWMRKKVTFEGETTPSDSSEADSSRSVPESDDSLQHKVNGCAGLLRDLYYFASLFLCVLMYIT